MMTDAEKPAFVAALSALATLKPGVTLTREAFALWWGLFRETWTLIEFQQACRNLATECEFFPNPYHFEQLRKAVLPNPAEIWPRVVAMLPMNGERRALELQANPLPAVALRVVDAMGGWRVLEMAETATRHFRERRFAELWLELDQVDEARAALSAPRPGTRAVGAVPAGDVLSRVVR